MGEPALVNLVHRVELACRPLSATVLTAVTVTAPFARRDCSTIQAPVWHSPGPAYRPLEAARGCIGAGGEPREPLISTLGGEASDGHLGFGGWYGVRLLLQGFPTRIFPQADTSRQRAR